MGKKDSMAVIMDQELAGFLEILRRKIKETHDKCIPVHLFLRYQQCRVESTEFMEDNDAHLIRVEGATRTILN